MRAGRSLRRLAMVFCCAGLFLALSLPVPAEDLVKGNPKIRVGVAGSLFRDAPAPLVSALLKPFKSLLDTQTGINGQMVAAGDAEDLGKQLADDKVQLGVFHGFEFAWARLKHPELKPLMIAVNQQRHLKACLLVRHDSDAVGIEDLKDKVLALPRGTREHSRLFLQRLCQANGKEPKQIFAQIATPSNME